MDLERPSEVLRLDAIDRIEGPIALDTETTGLYVDDGARIAVVSLTYWYKDDDAMYGHAFPFDVGRAEAKGFPVLKPAQEGDPDWDEQAPNLPRSEWEHLCEWLSKAVGAHGLVNQNIKFDLHLMNRGAPHGWPGVELESFIRPGGWWDTMPVSALLWPGMPTGLKPVAARLEIGSVEEKAELDLALAAAKRRYGLTLVTGPRFDLIPWSILGPYALQDTILVQHLMSRQKAEIASGGGEFRVTDREIDRVQTLGRILYRMETRGLGPVDVEAAREAITLVTRRMEKVRGVLEENAWFSPLTPVAAKGYFFDTLGLKPWRVGEEPRRLKYGPDGQVARAKNGNIKVEKHGDLSRAVLTRLVEEGVVGAAEWLEYQTLGVVNTMHYQGYLDLLDGTPQSRIRSPGESAPGNRYLRTDFKQNTVRSGRLAVSRFQAQALPKPRQHPLVIEGHTLIEPRRLIGVAPGRTRVNLDLNQAELRIAARMAECEKMLQRLAEGGDLHGETTTELFRVGPEHPEWKVYRDIGKRATFSGIFGVGPVTFRNMVWNEAGIDMGQDMARNTINGWRTLYPEFPAMKHQWEQHAAMYRSVPLYDDTLSPMNSDRDFPDTGWSRRVQASLAAWVCYEWLPMIERLTYKMEALVLTVHDSVVLDLPEKEADAITAEIVDRTSKMWFRAFGIEGGCTRSDWWG